MRIKEIRRSQNMTQKQLAQAIGVSYTVISKYEKGTVTPPAHRLESIANVLGVTVSALFSQENVNDRLDGKNDGHPPYDSLDADKFIFRNNFISRYIIMLSKGVCELCGRPAPFSDNEGQPYLEIHHVVWLSEGGMPTINNTVALCPNCHRKIHVVNDPDDILKLKDAASKHK